MQQQYINGEFEANYEVDDYTEYAKQHPTTEEEIAEARQGTKEPWAEMAQRLEEANPWIKDEWILYIPQSYVWRINRDADGDIIERELTFIIYNPNEQTE